MNTVEKGRQVIINAETSLRELISKALVEHRYADVKQLAELADGVAQLLQGNDIQLSTTSSHISSGAKVHKTENESAKESRPEVSSSKRARLTVKHAPRAKKDYPKFARDENRLVKVGWSKKNKCEYEHRVPREAVLAFVRHLDNKADEGKVFDIDGLFPVSDGSEGEVPGYQVYVIVAWLREVGVIEKKGRDGYLIRDKSLLRGELDEQWNSLQPR